MDGVSPAWPLDYDTLAPFYERAERLYQVHGELGTDPTEPDRGTFPPADSPLRGNGRHRSTTSRAGAAPIAVAARHSRRLHSLRHLQLLCAGKVHAKSEAEVCCVRPALEQPNIQLWTNAYARRLVTNAAGTRLEAVEVERTDNQFASSRRCSSCRAEP